MENTQNQIPQTGQASIEASVNEIVLIEQHPIQPEVPPRSSPRLSGNEYPGNVDDEPSLLNDDV